MPQLVSKLQSGQPLPIIKTVRWILIAGFVPIVLLVHFVFGLSLPLLPLGVLLAVMVGWNLSAHHLLGRLPAIHRTRLELLVDVAALSALFYLTGGPTNPFIFTYLAPVVLAAVALHWRDAALLALLSGVAYSLLLRFYVPLPRVHERFGGDFNIHVLGMWMNFLLTAFLTVVIVALLAQGIRSRDKALRQARERKLRDQQILGLATLAAGAAHELNTPLSTMAILTDECRSRASGDQELADDLDLLRAQIDACRTSVKRLLGAAGSRRPHDEPGSVGEMIWKGVEDWWVTRPEIAVNFNIFGTQNDVMIDTSAALRQALLNLLDNAADASLANSSPRVDVEVEITGESLRVEIRDFGSGIAWEQDQTVSQKPGGHGLGLKITAASLEQMNGRLSFDAHGDGTVVTLEIPLASLSSGPRTRETVSGEPRPSYPGDAVTPNGERS